jgi:hypothetical protein
VLIIGTNYYDPYLANDHPLASGYQVIASAFEPLIDAAAPAH